MRTLADCRLYGILDLSYVAEPDAERVVAAMIEGGVDIIQLRDKKSDTMAIRNLAAKLHPITSAAEVPLIVNDYTQIAASVPVEGVHVGQNDDPVAAAREKAKRPIIVGKSTHSVEQARAAQGEGADYIGFGPIFATPTKPGYQPVGVADIKRVHANATLPIFCIGGIKIENLGKLMAAGAKRVAIVSALLKAPDIAKYARGCKALLNPEI